MTPLTRAQDAYERIAKNVNVDLPALLAACARRDCDAQERLDLLASLRRHSEETRYLLVELYRSMLEAETK